jgi:hypothetical protein
VGPYALLLIARGPERPEGGDGEQVENFWDE